MKNFLLAIPIFYLLSACGESEIKPTINYEVVGGQGKMHFVYIKNEPEITKESYLNIGDYICRRENICIVMFWNEKPLIPNSIPMSDEQVKAKVAHYNLNKNTGLHKVAICNVDGCN